MTEVVEKRGRGRPATGRKKQYKTIAERGLPDMRSKRHSKHFKYGRRPGEPKSRYIPVAERGLPDRRHSDSGNLGGSGRKPGHKGCGGRKMIGDSPRKKCSVTFSPEVLEAVRKIAEQNNIKMAAFIEQCVRKEILRAKTPESMLILTKKNE